MLDRHFSRSSTDHDSTHFGMRTVNEMYWAPLAHRAFSSAFGNLEFRKMAVITEDWIRSRVQLKHDNLGKLLLRQIQ